MDEFLIDREIERMTHRVLREGHLWGQKDGLIPVSEVEQINEERIDLTLTKAQVSALPTIPVRHWHEDLQEG